MALSISLRVGIFSISSFTGTWGRRLIASLLMLEWRFKILLNCSAHLSKIMSLSVSSVMPSALRRGDEPEDVGPYTS